MLTGGASTRMGRDKALLEVDGRPLALTVASTLRAAGAGRVVAVGGDAAGISALGIEVVPDEHPGEGPLGGLLTAFAAARTEVVVVLACDLPGIDEHTVRVVVGALLADPHLAAAWPAPEAHGAPGAADVEHVLHGAWRVPVAHEVLTAAFDAGERSVRRAAAGLSRRLMHGIEPATLRNANRPEDLLGHRGVRRSETSRRHNGRMTDPAPLPEVDVAALASAPKDAYVLDVRQPDEYEAAHVPGAVLLPLDQLGARLDEVPGDQHLYVICKSGGRSAAAVEALTGAGYEATNVSGGTTAWIEAGHPTVSGPGAGRR